jgi:hypothetical protein
MTPFQIIGLVIAQDLFLVFGHSAVGRKVRQTIQELGGTMPENLPVPDKSIKQLESAAKKLSKKQPPQWNT